MACFHRASLIILLLALNLPAAHPALAQDIPARSKLGPAPKGPRLYSWCQAQVAYSYGSRNQPTYQNLATKKPVIVIDADLMHSKTEACFRSGGAVY